MKLFSLLFRNEENQPKKLFICAENPHVARETANGILTEHGYENWKYQTTEPVRAVITDENSITVGMAQATA